MISYENMQYLSAFERLGTLSGVADEFHISQPTITRCMKKIEEELGFRFLIEQKTVLS